MRLDRRIIATVVICYSRLLHTLNRQSSCHSRASQAVNSTVMKPLEKKFLHSASAARIRDGLPGDSLSVFRSRLLYRALL